MICKTCKEDKDLDQFSKNRYLQIMQHWLPRFWFRHKPDCRFTSH